MDQNNESTPTEIVPQMPMSAIKFDPEQQISNATKAANALVAVLKPTKIQNRDYFQFEHWQTIARFYGHSVGVEWTKPVMRGDEIWGFEAKAQVFNSAGTVVGGAEGSCIRDEANWKDRDEFQLKSMAQTRAMAKALRSIFGFVAVLAGVNPTPAEEMDGIDHGTQQQAKTTPRTAQAASDAPLCEIHNKPMRKNSRGWYCATKLEDDSWCNYKPGQRSELEEIGDGIPY